MKNKIKISYSQYGEIMRLLKESRKHLETLGKIAEICEEYEKDKKNNHSRE